MFSLFLLLNPTNVAEVHTVWQQVMFWIHTQSKFHTTCVRQLVFSFEEQTRILSLYQFQWLNFEEFVVVMGRGANCYEFYADTLVVQAFGVKFNCDSALVTNAEFCALSIQCRTYYLDAIPVSYDVLFPIYDFLATL